MKDTPDTGSTECRVESLYLPVEVGRHVLLDLRVLVGLSHNGGPRGPCIRSGQGWRLVVLWSSRTGYPSSFRVFRQVKLFLLTFVSYFFIKTFEGLRTVYRQSGSPLSVGNTGGTEVTPGVLLTREVVVLRIGSSSILSLYTTDVFTLVIPL